MKQSSEQIPHVQHISFYDLKSSTESSLQIFFRHCWFISHPASIPRNSLSYGFNFFKPGLFKGFVAAKMLPAHPLTTLHQTHENPFTWVIISCCFGDGLSGAKRLGHLHPKLTFRSLCLHIVRNLWLCCTLVTPSSFAAAFPHVPLCKAEYGIFQTLSFKRLSKPLKMLWKQLENKRFFVFISVFLNKVSIFSTAWRSVFSSFP